MTHFFVLTRNAFPYGTSYYGGGGNSEGGNNFGRLSQGYQSQVVSQVDSLFLIHIPQP